MTKPSSRRIPTFRRASRPFRRRSGPRVFKRPGCCSYLPQPFPCSPLVPAESDVFPLRPSHQELIQRAQGATKCRGVKSSIILHPPHDHGSGPPGEFVQPEIGPMMQPPATYALPHRLGRVPTYCGCETDEALSHTILRRTWAKGITQKVEALHRIVPPPIGILAVHDLRLVRVKFQVPLPSGVPKRISEGTRLRFAHTVAADVVSVALEGDLGVLLRHPPIECLMQNQVGQKRADHRTLRCSLTPFH